VLLDIIDELLVSMDAEILDMYGMLIIVIYAHDLQEVAGV
jgi:hypothetical protein